MGMIYDIFPFKDFNPSLIPRLLENFRRIQHAFNFLQSRYFQKEPVWDAKQDAIHQGPTPPENPTEGTFWLDTSQQPNVLYRYEGGQWVKVTPTEPEEIGAEPRIARGSTPPSNPKADDIWIDTSTTPPVWKRWTGSAWEKMTRTHFAELFGQITGAQIAPESIEPTHIAWLDAALITTGTMLFNRVRGGTAELGGSGNGNGVLIVRDASGTERGRLDNAGITITDANFLLKESRSGVTQSIVAATNMVNDHSFELVPRKGSADAYQTFEVDETYMYNLHWWQPVPSPSKTVNPRVLSTYDTDLPQLALFDFQAVVVRGSNQYVWRQLVPVDQSAGLSGPYTGSAHFAAYGATTANTTAYIEFYASDFTFSHIALLGRASVPIVASEKFKWKRAYVTFSNLPAETRFVEIQIYSSPDVPILCDGVQLVAAPYPVVYNPESALWRHARGLSGYVNVEGISGGQPPSIRITRTGAQAIQSGVSTPISWQGRYPGYNSAGMWSPNQPNLSQIFAPESGTYLIVCTIRWAANGNGYRLAAIKVNGGDNIAKVQEPPAPAGSPMYQQVTGVAHLNAGDYIQIVVLQNSGVTLNLETEVQTAPVLTMIKIA